MPIICLCDACAVEAAAGDPPFAALGDLLDFEPVPRKRARADGWDADCQRAFIAALAVCGSKRQAAQAVGKAQFGVDQLLAAEGSEGFAAACKQAIVIANETQRHRRARRISALAERTVRPIPPAWNHAASRQDPPRVLLGEGDHAQHGGGVADDEEEEEDDSDEARMHWLAGFIDQYVIKIASERAARLAGEIVAADFYLRQATHMEVMLDLASSGGLFALMRTYRDREHEVTDIAETTVTRMLDAARREAWAELGEPPRPPIVPRDLLEDHGGYATEPQEATESPHELSHDEQWARFQARHAEDAAAQLRWEAEARRDYERRRDSDAAS